MKNNTGEESHIRPATVADAQALHALLTSVTRWLKDHNIPLWSENMFTPENIVRDLLAYSYFVAEDNGEIVGTFRFQLEDPEVWPEVTGHNSAFIHRVVVARSHTGRGVAQQMIRHAQLLTLKAGRRYLRLDCASERPKLRAVYERAGFTWRDDTICGPFAISRYEWQAHSRPKA